MNRFVSMVLVAASFAGAAFAQESCTTCHGKTQQLEAHRIHALSGVDCIACHGGVPDAWTVEEAHPGIVVPRDRTAMVELCGGCHADSDHMRAFGTRTDQLATYWTSGHGATLRDDPAAMVASCVDCHGAHGVFAVDHARAPTHARNQPQTCGACHSAAGLMETFELAADVVDLYASSVHGTALLAEGLLSSPSCTDCHGAHGATPPNVAKVGLVCGSCHVPALDAFRNSPHAAAANAGAMEQCTACHDAHGASEPSLAMLVGDEAGHCGECHEAGSTARATGEEIHALLTRFDASLDEIDRSLAAAYASGVFVEEQMAWLTQARAVRGRVAPMVHTLDPKALASALEPAQGMLAKSREGLSNGHRALRDRRIFVGVFAALVLVMAAALLLHAREVGRRGGGNAVERGESARA